MQVKCLTASSKTDRFIWMKKYQKCPCGQTFIYASERDLSMKLQLHCRICTKPPEGSMKVSEPKKAMTLKEAQCNKVEKVS